MADRRDHRDQAGGHGAHDDFLVEAPKVFERAATPRHDDDIGPRRHAVEAVNCRGHFGGARLALDTHRPDQHMTRETLVQPVQDIADHRTGRRGDDADEARQIGDGFFARRIEQAFGGELALAFFEQRHQRAGTGWLDVFDDDLIGGFHRIGRDLAGGDDLEPLLQFRAQPAETAAPDHRVDLRTLVLDREVAMARGHRPPEAGDFAAHPHQAESVFQGALQSLRQFAHRVFAGVGLLVLDDLAGFGIVIPDR